MTRTESEIATFRAALQLFVPPNTFDAHLHLFRRQDVPGSVPAELFDPDGQAGWSSYTRAADTWMGERRPTAGLAFAFPKPGLDIESANQFVADEVRPLADARALMIVRPGDDPAHVEATLTRERFAGFKVYHVYADADDTFESPTEAFLPEWAWELADRYELAIMLHIVRARALADPLNQSYICEHCLRYPGARLILAHAARGFCATHTVDGIATLRGLDNVFFDTSAICEAAPFEAIVRAFGTRRLMFGTDFPVSAMLGRAVSVGDGFAWLYEHNFDWQHATFAQPLPIGLESLLALRQACWTMRLVDEDVEHIFCHNARRMLGIVPEPNADRGQTAYRRAREIIPGGTQLLSKRPEMHAPDRWPAYFAEAHGCEVVDLDGRRFCDMTTSGIGSCLLGYADPDVTAAVIRRVELGSMSTLNCPEEPHLAELLLELHPWAEAARFCRTGGESMAVAVRIARASTGRDRVAFCGYHGWSDWYLAANLPPADSGGGTEDSLSEHLLPGLEPAGVPSALAGTALPFRYNRLDELEQIVARHGNELAAVVMEPTRSIDPEPGFLEGVRELCRACGAVLVFDEISVGWRLALGGAHRRYGVTPDVAVFAKALGNGHPIGAIIGRAAIMNAAQSTFISSTYWTEGVGFAAAVATVRKFQQHDLPAHAAAIGDRFRAGWLKLGQKHGVPTRVGGHPAIGTLGFDHPDAAALGTLLTSRMLERGFLLSGGFYPSLAHEPRHVDTCLAAADTVFAELAEAVAQGDAQQRLAGPVRHSGFARLS